LDQFYAGLKAFNSLGTGVSDHGALGGLADDDHPQYPQAADPETITGAWVFGHEDFVIGDGTSQNIEITLDAPGATSGAAALIRYNYISEIVQVVNKGFVAGDISIGDAMGIGGTTKTISFGTISERIRYVALTDDRFEINRPIYLDGSTAANRELRNVSAVNYGTGSISYNSVLNEFTVSDLVRMSSANIKDVADPVDAQDGATKNYVDVNAVTPLATHIADTANPHTVTLEQAISAGATATTQAVFDGGLALNDNDNITLGTGSDVTIDFTGTNLEINRVVGSPDLVLDMPFFVDKSEFSRVVRGQERVLARWPSAYDRGCDEQR
jgi:hypothetical protein